MYYKEYPCFVLASWVDNVFKGTGVTGQICSESSKLHIDLTHHIPCANFVNSFLQIFHKHNIQLYNDFNQAENLASLCQLAIPLGE